MVAFFTLASTFLTAALAWIRSMLAKLSRAECGLGVFMVVCCEQASTLELAALSLEGDIQHPSGQVTKLAFFATVASFLGAVFLVTPVGLAPAFLVVVVGVERGLRAITGAVSTVWNTRGFELPVADRVPSRAIVGDVDWKKLWAQRVSRGYFQGRENSEWDGTTGNGVRNRDSVLRDANNVVG